ncbi:MAG TPA: nucleotidyltransferase family protein [Longimicrobiales bacterium]|nr:nucleotidyltransferase family protein [Longimicrobiales bacterium]
MSETVDGVILAAGLSTRMDRPKPLLEVGDTTFLERAIRTLKEGGCRYIVAVVNEADDWTQRLADATGAAVVVNDQPESEQIESLRLGIGALPGDWSAVAVLPVDVPLVAADTVRLLVAAFTQHGAPITLPFHNGVAGHPVLVGRSIAAEIMTGTWEEGVRSVIMAHAHDLREVKVMDPGILIDVDTPEDYWRYVKDRNR